MATYLHAREADAYARLLERRRRSKAAPSFRFEPRAMPTIQERPVGLPPPGLRYTLYAPRRAEPAVDEQAAAAAEARRRAARICAGAHGCHAARSRARSSTPAALLLAQQLRARRCTSREWPSEQPIIASQVAHNTDYTSQ